MPDGLFIKVPCGYGLPGELPKPLPKGADGGVVMIPGDPGTTPPGQYPGGPVVDPGDPGIPNTPNVLPPIIVTFSDTTCDIQVNLDANCNVSCVLYGPSLQVFVFTNLTIFQQNWIIPFTGLTPDSPYQFDAVFSLLSFPQLQAFATGNFVTNSAPLPNSPNIIPPVFLNITDTTCDIQVNLDADCNASCVLYGPNSEIIVFTNLTTFQQNWVIPFTGLTPDSPYQFEAVFSLISFPQLQAFTTGGFSTNATPIIVIPSIGPSVEPPFDPLILELPVQNFKHITILNTNNNFNQSVDLVYRQIINKSAISKTELDLKYTPYTITPTKFLPIYGIKDDNVFEPVRHASIDRILNQKSSSFEEANLDFQNISFNHIKSSLKANIKKTLFNLVYPNGIEVSPSLISKSIINFIKDNNINRISTEYISEIKDFISGKTSRKIITPTIKKSNYGTNVKELSSNRSIKEPTIIKSNKLIPNKFVGEKLIRKSTIPIDGRKYNDDSRELFKLWYTLPEDIYKRIDVLEESGSIFNAYIRNTDDFVILDEGGVSIIEGEVTINDSVEIINSIGNIEDIFLQSEIARANVLRNEDEHLIMYHLGIEKDIIMEVSCVDPLIEFNAETSNIPNSHYILKLNTSDITDSFLDESPFIRETHASYNLMTDSSFDLSVIDTDIAYKAYPWLVLPINIEDPIIDYFTFALSDNNYSFRFRDLSYNLIGFPEEKSTQLIVRKIPRYIIILPTDKYKYNLFNQKSNLKDWNIRSMRFVFPFDKNILSPGLIDHPLTVQNTYIYSQGENKDIDFSTQAYRCFYSPTSVTFNNAYNDINNIPERTQVGFRAALSIIESLDENYNLNNGLTYYDVLSRLNRSELYSFLTDNDNKIINKLRNGENTDLKLYHVAGPKVDDASKRGDFTRILGLKDTGIIVDQEYNEYDPTIPAPPAPPVVPLF